MNALAGVPLALLREKLPEMDERISMQEQKLACLRAEREMVAREIENRMD